MADRALTYGHTAWLLASLGRAIQKVSTTTGHFAQYLAPKAESIARYVQQRQRNLWDSFIESIPIDGPLGSDDWRRNNRAFGVDALALVSRLSRLKARPSVIYADPPYTEDHYSRYYHLFETLVRYDYPELSGKARYRAARFQTSFSLKIKATAA